MLAVAMPDVGHLPVQAREQAVHVGRVLHAERARQVLAPDPGIPEPSHQVDHAILGDGAFVRAPERHADRHHERDAVALGDLERQQVLLDRLVVAHVLVVARVGLARGDQAEQLAHLRVHRAVRAARVRRLPPVDDARAAADPREDLLGIAHVRHDPRVREARHLDHRHAELGQAVAQPDLVVGVDPAGQALQAVAGGDVDEQGLLGQVHGGNRSGGGRFVRMYG
jgi:hypothetical protein